MDIRFSYSMIGAAVLSCGALAFAQTNEQTTGDRQQTATITAGQADPSGGTPITLVGCVQRESEYRRQQDSGRGGPAATGLGLGNEYILVNASRVESGGSSPQGQLDCAAAGGTGEAYELTGKSEPELKAFVGKRVEITGMLKKARTASSQETAGTSGTTGARPTGGFDPLGQDLELFEVEMSSFREASMPQASASGSVQSAPTDRAAEAATESAGTAGRAQQPQGSQTVESQERLPATASPLPIAGLIGLLSMAGAVGVRMWRRR